jgi:cell division septal protein FtsQ
MWFENKPKNRRLKREHLLEVKASSQQRRQARWRLVGVTLGMMAGLILILLAFWVGGTWVINRLVYENEVFATETIQIQTDGVLPVEMIRRWAGVKAGDNLLALDLDVIRLNLKKVPLVKDAAVERDPPRTLRIRVVEREPIAQVHVLQPRAGEDGYDVVSYYLDEEGSIMSRPESWLPGAKAWHAVDSLPVVCGLDGSELHPGWTVESSRVKSALQLIGAFSESSMYGYADLARVDVSAPEVIRLTTQQGAEIIFWPDHFERQLSRWKFIHDLVKQQGKAIASLDLSISNNLPARWMDASSAPAVSPKPAKKIRTQRKHV